MSPPISLSNCPKEFQENPLPYDECAAPKENFVLPQYRFRYVSLGHEWNIPLYNPADMSTRLGAYGLFRPHRNFGIGFNFDTDFEEEVTFHGRLQASYWLDRFGITRLNVAPLLGLRHLFEQRRGLEEAPTATPKVAGTLLSTGLELGVDLQLLKEFSLGTYLRFLYSPPTDVQLAGPSATPVRIEDHQELVLGLRAGFDLAPNH